MTNQTKTRVRASAMPGCNAFVATQNTAPLRARSRAARLKPDALSGHTAHRSGWGEGITWSVETNLGRHRSRGRRTVSGDEQYSHTVLAQVRNQLR